MRGVDQATDWAALCQAEPAPAEVRWESAPAPLSSTHAELETSLPEELSGCDGGRMVIQITDEQAAGALYEFDWFIQPSRRMNPPHYHPTQEERFEGVAGTPHVMIDGTRHILVLGDHLVVPPGTFHTVGNPTTEMGHAIARRACKHRSSPCSEDLIRVQPAERSPESEWRLRDLLRASGPSAAGANPSARDP